MEWGYGGSGPADAALSILTDLVGPQSADEHYMDFKWEFVARLPYEGRRILVIDILAWLQSREPQP
jgi:hypothetical protein